jgi:hypothetical protein
LLTQETWSDHPPRNAASAAATSFNLTPFLPLLVLGFALLQMEATLVEQGHLDLLGIPQAVQAAAEDALEFLAQRARQQQQEQQELDTTISSTGTLGSALQEEQQQQEQEGDQGAAIITSSIDSSTLPSESDTSSDTESSAAMPSVSGDDSSVDDSSLPILGNSSSAAAVSAQQQEEEEQWLVMCLNGSMAVSHQTPDSAMCWQHHAYILSGPHSTVTT